MAEQLTYNTAGTHVHVRHTETGHVWESPLEYLATAKQRGWEPYDPAAADEPAPVVDEVADPPLFDPTEHSVEDVAAHLAAHAEGGNPGEVERVLDLERKGKNRKSIAVPDGFDPITGS